MPLQKCICSPLDVLGWSGAKRVQVVPSPGNAFGDQSFGTLAVQRVPAVYARYIHDNSGVARRSLPSVSSGEAWQVELPATVPVAKYPYLAEPPDNKPFYTTTLWGSHPFRFNNQWHVAYPMGFLVGPDIENVDEDSHVPTHVCIVNLETRSLVTTYHLPMVHPSTAFPNAYWFFSGDFGGGGHQPNFNPIYWGFSGKTWIVSGKYRDGTPWLHRHNFETGEHGLALASYSIVEGECIIELPAQASDDGRGWVIAIKHGDSDAGIYTGPWENPHVSTNFVDPSAFPAILTPAERLNRVDNKPGDGKTWNVSGVSILAYTRMHGFDYILARHEPDGDDAQMWYYDGRRERWQYVSTIDGATPDDEVSGGWYPIQIYNCEDGSVVLANETRIQYRGADGRIVWDFHYAFGQSIPTRGIKISDNGKWIMVTNTIGSRAQHSVLSTADTTEFGTHAFSGNIVDYPIELDTGADWPLNWSFSKEPLGEDGQPIVILHREYDTREWFPYFYDYIDEEEMPVRGPDPSYEPEDGYTVRIYCGNPDIKRGDYTNGPGVNGKQHYMGGPNVSIHWALWPGCQCCGGPSVTPTGY